MELRFTTLSAYGDPVDPAYVRFKTGILSQKGDVADAYRWRWDPVQGAWYTYPATKWSLDSSGLGVTHTPATVLWGQKQYNYWESSLPDTFKSLHTDYLKMAKTHPAAIWFFGTGHWFAPTYIGPKVPNTNPDKVDIPPEA